MKKINNIAEFQKLFKIPIPYEPEFDYYLNTLCKSDEFKYKIPHLLEEFHQYEHFVYNDWESPKKYKLDYALPKMIDYIKNSRAYEDLQNWETPDIKFFRKDGYKMEENDGCYFLSIDFTSANFSTFKLFDTKAKNEFKDNWAELCDHLDIHKTLASSKSFRQYVFGNTNPKRIGKIQHYHIMRMVKMLDEKFDDLDYMFVSHDELIIKLKSTDLFTGIANEARGIIYTVSNWDGLDFPIHTEIFKLDKLAKSIYVKTHYTLMNNKIGAGDFISSDNWYLSQFYKSIHGAPGNLYFQYFKKHILEEEVEDRDLYFQDNGRLCKWVVKKDDDHKKVDRPVELEGEKYYKIPKQLRKALPGITDEDISKIIAVYEDTCKYCKEGDSRCQCWNDE